MSDLVDRIVALIDDGLLEHPWQREARPEALPPWRRAAWTWGADPGARPLDLYYDLDGRPITADQYLELLAGRWTVRTRTGDGSSTPADDPTRIGWATRGAVAVSTVWLGINHNWGSGPPLIFETMIFGGVHDGATWRYHTREQAARGHADACALVWSSPVPAKPARRRRYRPHPRRKQERAR